MKAWTMKGMQLLAKFVKPFQQNSHLKWYGYEIILSKHCEQILSRTFHFAVSVLLLQGKNVQSTRFVQGNVSGDRGVSFGLLHDYLNTHLWLPERYLMK